MSNRPYVLGVFPGKHDASKALRAAVALQGKQQRTAAEEAGLKELTGRLDHLGADRWIDLVGGVSPNRRFFRHQKLSCLPCLG